MVEFRNVRSALSLSRVPWRPSSGPTMTGFQPTAANQKKGRPVHSGQPWWVPPLAAVCQGGSAVDPSCGTWPPPMWMSLAGSMCCATEPSQRTCCAAADSLPPQAAPPGSHHLLLPPSATAGPRRQPPSGAPTAATPCHAARQPRWPVPTACPVAVGVAVG